MNKNEIKDFLINHAHSYIEDAFENDATPIHLAMLGYFWESYNEYAEEYPERMEQLNSELNKESILEILEKVETSFDSSNLIDRLEESDEPEKVAIEEHFKSKMYWRLADPAE